MLRTTQCAEMAGKVAKRFKVGFPCLCFNAVDCQVDFSAALSSPEL